MDVTLPCLDSASLVAHVGLGSVLVVYGLVLGFKSGTYVHRPLPSLRVRSLGSLEGLEVVSLHPPCTSMPPGKLHNFASLDTSLPLCYCGDIPNPITNTSEAYSCNGGYTARLKIKHYCMMAQPIREHVHPMYSITQLTNMH